jgi:hypothetical protein
VDMAIQYAAERKHDYTILPTGREVTDASFAGGSNTRKRKFWAYRLLDTGWALNQDSGFHGHRKCNKSCS